MKILGYARSYAAGRALAKELGYDFAYCVNSNQAPCAFTVLVPL